MNSDASSSPAWGLCSHSAGCSITARTSSEGLAVTHLARARLAFVGTPHARGFLLVVGQAQFLILQPADLVTQAACFLELQIGRGGTHAFFEVFDITAQIVPNQIVALVIAQVDSHAIL